MSVERPQTAALRRYNYSNRATCPKCGGGMRPSFGHDMCGKCRKAMIHRKPNPRSLGVCPQCGRGMDVSYGHATCAKCRRNVEYLGKVRHAVGYSERLCNICGKVIGRVPPEYDERHVRFCESCRLGPVRRLEMIDKMTIMVRHA